MDGVDNDGFGLTKKEEGMQREKKGRKEGAQGGCSQGEDWGLDWKSGFSVVVVDLDAVCS